ncbi:AAA family ATPase [Paludisphaera soli]|uniref:AAA family ATPase n=1 Tax=Paludisphaera soli TaxID=2712865 RepID=UPI0013ECDF44|nr:AAA family ATPase [Paludisphaera soli]
MVDDTADRRDVLAESSDVLPAVDRAAGPITEPRGVEPPPAPAWKVNAAAKSGIEDAAARVAQEARARARARVVGSRAAGAAPPGYAGRSDDELGLVAVDHPSSDRGRTVIRRLATTGQFTGLVADGGAGKTQLTLRVVAQLSLGRDLSPVFRTPKAARVLLVSGEDSRRLSVLPRLRSMGAELTRIVCSTASVRSTLESGEVVERPVRLDDLAYWGEVVGRARPDLVVIDPIANYMPGGASSNSSDDVTDAIAPFLSLMKRHDCALIGVLHMNKAKGGDHRSLAGLVRGSTAWVALARRVFLMSLRRDEPGRGVLVHAKGNAGPRLPALGYHFEPIDPGLAIPDPNAYTAEEREVVEWLSNLVLDGEVDRADAEAVVAGEGEGPKGRPARAALDAAAWLAAELAARPGREAAYRDLLAAAGAAGILGAAVGSRPDGRPEYASPNPLYRARDAVARLGGEWAGAEVRCRGRAPAYWTLVLPAYPQASSPHESTAGAEGPQVREEAAEEPSTSPSASGS